MILNNAPQHEAIVSNVGEIGEFRIRNSAKAFSILSSGLYANKIRAIVRELSCNAVDSHAAADKKETPFDVHLPNTLEPWFSIRDYGTGLSHDQVTQIYTTYFESTKTASNEFIGALGLGSKSPFSYTDNFTVTAIQNGKKGIYSAFINGEGVPSIALMQTEATDEANGVEVKFSVNDRYDFDKFRQEARQVYTHFKLRPNISGNADFGFINVEYETENIIPGVHSTNSSRMSTAVMGNIAYPISIPEADKSLGDLRQLLTCGLEMHFAIGELDFQASREGLSYIPQTIESIKRKLEAVNTALTVVLAKEADAIENLWERAVFLVKKKDKPLWFAAVNKYATDAKLVTFVEDKYGTWKTAKFGIKVADLQKDHNIVIRGIQRTRQSKTVSTIKQDTEYADGNAKDANGHYITWQQWNFTVNTDCHFVINNLKTGALERTKFHYRETQCDVYSRNVYIIEAYDKAKPMKIDEFFAKIHQPPAANRINASSLMEKPAKDRSLGKNVTIMVLGEKGYGGYYRQREMVWKDGGKASSFDANETYYYLPLSGFSVESKYGMNNVKQFHTDLKECGVKGLQETIYGVRKGDIDFIKTQKNWVNIEDHIAGLLSKVDVKLMMGLVVNQVVDSYPQFVYTSSIANDITDANSPYLKLVKQFEGHEKIRYSEYSLKRLSSQYAKGTNFSPEAFVQKFVDECSAVNKQYPLLQYLRSAPNKEIADYVNLIDTQKGV
jgi:hypothetical protein